MTRWNKERMKHLRVHLLMEIWCYKTRITCSNWKGSQPCPNHRLHWAPFPCIASETIHLNDEWALMGNRFDQILPTPKLCGIIALYLYQFHSFIKLMLIPIQHASSNSSQKEKMSFFYLSI